MTPSLYAQLFQLGRPEIAIAVTALFLLGADLAVLRRATLRLRFTVAAIFTFLGCTAAIHHLLRANLTAALPGNILLANPTTAAVQIGLLALTILVALLSIDSDFTTHVGEFFALILFSTIGGLFLVASQNILVLFLALELLSLCLYLLTAFDKRRPTASEAALKYFLFGGMSAAFLLFGFSLLYGLSNSLELSAIAAAAHAAPANPLLLVAIVCTAIGLGFKIAAAPLHFWAPDVYQAAPAPAAAFIASASKLASFFLLFQFVAIGFAGAEGTLGLHIVPGWQPVLAALAVLSMVLGNLVAIVQTSVRRLLAYSAVAHAGYMLLAILAHTQQSLAALLFYVFTYSIAIIGLFAIIAAVEHTEKERATGPGQRNLGKDSFDSFNGLSRRSPLLSLCLFLFLLSLAGIPPLAGFFGKFYVFVAAYHAMPTHSMLALIILAIAASAVSLYYYLSVLKRAYVTDPAADAAPIRVPALTLTLLLLLAAATVLLGCAPHLLLGWLTAATQAVGF
jgi:NADH-quinone oxidoreductase subunit N